MNAHAYPDNWNAIADAVKSLAFWHCEACGHPHDPEHGYTLTVHHLDGNPANCAYTNLVALCQRCHLRIQAGYVPGQLFIESTAPRWARIRGLHTPWDERTRERIDAAVVLPVAQSSTRYSGGVVPLVCSCCRKVVGVENREAWEARCRDGEHYFCSACMQLPPAVVEELLADDPRDPGGAQTGVCWAYDDSGAICRQPAIGVDVERGFTVCARHHRG